MADQETFLANLTKAIEQAKKITSKLYIISILPVASAIDGITVPSGKQRSNQMITQYNTLLQQLSVQHEVTYIDVYNPFFENKDVYLSRDGVHPNDKGYQFIAEQIKPIIEAVL